MKVVILCGGEGTRLREETEFKPKPLVTVGSIPLLLHIMKIYSDFGFTEFVLCLGYKGEMIKDYFKINFDWNDSTLLGKDGLTETRKISYDGIGWTVTFADTGLKVQTGARVKKIEKYVDGEDFLVTYGDGVSNIPIPATIELHKKLKTIVTLCGVHPRSKYGSMEIHDNIVTKFVEKPILKDYVNGGFYVFNRKIFNYLTAEDSCVLETFAFSKLADERKIAIYRHEGFWFSVDTYKEYLDLNDMWNKGIRPWWKGE